LTRLYVRAAVRAKWQHCRQLTDVADTVTVTVTGVTVTACISITGHNTLQTGHCLYSVSEEKLHFILSFHDKITISQPIKIKFAGNNAE